MSSPSRTIQLHLFPQNVVVSSISDRPVLYNTNRKERTRDLRDQGLAEVASTVLPHKTGNSWRSHLPVLVVWMVSMQGMLRKHK